MVMTRRGFGSCQAHVKIHNAAKGLPLWSTPMRDNDQDAREVLSCILQDAGYSILQACNVSEGLRLARLNHDIGVALVDVHLDDRLTGLEILVSLRERLPFTQLIVMSGDWAALEKASDSRTLRKPYGSHEVVAAVGNAYQAYEIGGGASAMPKMIRRRLPAEDECSS
jgi:DNA-binding NtrC family response regulator